MTSAPAGERSPFLDTAISAGVVVFWSSGFVGAKIASASGASVFLVLFWRFAAASAILAVLVLALTRTRTMLLARGNRAALGWQALFGLLAMGGFIGCVTLAIDLGVPAGTAALIAALQPLATAGVASVVLGERIGMWGWIGLSLGLVGVTTAVQGSHGGAPLIAYALPFAAVAGVVTATVLAKRNEAAGKLPLPVVLLVQCIATSFAMLPLALGDGPLFPPLEWTFWAAVGWFILLSTFGAYGFYWFALARTSASRVASLIYLTPPVTALWALAMFGEPMGIPIVVGFGWCLTGVWLANRNSVPALRSTHTNGPNY